jgi:GNAT superfamily N-acetyltransferase
VEALTPAQAALEENMLEFFRECARVTPGVELHDGDDLFWSLTEIPFPIFNSLHRTRATTAALPAMIEAAKARSRSKSVPIAWFVGPGSHPDDLGETLERHGFTNEGTTPGMIADLRALPEANGLPPELRIDRIADETAARTWCDVLCDGFDLPRFLGDAHFALATRIGLQPDAIFAHYLAFWEGEPVATAMLFPAAGVAGIYNVTTLAAARRRGIGAAITRRALGDAKAAGLSTAVLQATEEGLGVYASLGFVECLRYAMYLWDPATVTRRG